MKGLHPRKIHTIGILFLVFAFTALGALVTFRVGSARSGDVELVANSLSETDVIRKISLTSNDIVYNPGDQTIYASVPSSAGASGNSIRRINPLTGVPGAPVFVGSEPTHLALSGDGQSLYVMLDGASAVRRYDTATQTPGSQFGLGRDPLYDRYYQASDIAVAPDNPDLLAVARSRPWVGPSEAGVAVFDNGVQRSQTGPGHSDGSDYLAFSTTGETLYGTGFSSGLKTMTIAANGVSVANSSTLAYGARIRYDNGLIFSSGGDVIDAASRTLLGTFADATSNAFVSDQTVGRAFYIVRNESTGVWQLKAYDTGTFALIGTLDINGVTGNPDALFRYGTNGLAFRTSGNQLFLIQTSLIPTPNPLPTPTATPTVTPMPPTLIAARIRRLPVAANDLVYDQTSQKLYASVNGNGGAHGNTITAIDPQAGTIDGSVFVGSEPGRLALANDGQTLYVALDGASAVRRVNLPTLSAGAQFPVGATSLEGPYRISGLAVAPDDPNLVAVARSYHATTGVAGVAVFDNGVRRPQTGPGPFGGSYSIAFGETGSTIYGSKYPGLSVMSVDANGVSVTANYPLSETSRIAYSDGKVYGTTGEVVNPASGAILGTFQVSRNAYPSPFVVPDPATGRVYFLVENNNRWELRAYDINTFVPLGAIALTDLDGDSARPTGFVRWGTNGLAIAAADQVFLINTALVNPGETVPAPTPTPSATPTATPTPAFVRRVNLLTKDLVFNEPTGALYATVPAAAGDGRGNTISRIDPATGAIASSVVIGSEPSLLALADDGQTLYIKLSGANAVRRFDLATETPGAQFTVSNIANVQDMAVLPGRPQSVALTQRFDGIAIYDDGVRRPNMSRGGAYSINHVETGANPATIYGYSSETSGNEFVKLAVDETGVSPAGYMRQLILGPYGEIKSAGGLVYANTGRVFDPETLTLRGTFGSGGSTVAVDTTLKRAYFLNANVLTTYDTETFVKLGAVTLPAFNGAAFDLVRWGANGLAFRVADNFNANSNQLFIVQSALVSTNGPVPTGYHITSGDPSVSENEAVLPVDVVRTGELSGTTTVDYATVEGTAHAGTDFEAAAGTLTFAPGETTKTVNLRIVNDDVYEMPENFSFVLNNPSAGGTLLLPGSSVVTINNDDPQPFIQINSLPISEPPPNGTATAVFRVSLTNPSIQTVSVDYATANGTATAGSDYVAASGSLIFNPLETSKDVSVVINGDGNLEPNETFFLGLTNAVNASGTVGSMTGLIINYNSNRRAQFDFDGDAKTDVSIFRPSNGEWWYLRSSDTENRAARFGTSADTLAPADYTGDGKTDIAFWQPSSGYWYILRSEDGSFFSFPFGLAGDIPAPSDYDGDGKADAAVFRPSDGTWYILNSGGGSVGIVQFGTAEDKPVAADYDGDGRADIAIFRPSDGSWWYLRSTDLQYRVYRFGIGTDKPVQGDYTGDGKADIAVWRPATGEWFVLRSENDSFYSVPFGQTGDLPTPGDYDGDGKFDTAVFRPSDSTWYVNGSAAGVSIVTFGLPDDLPVPNAFVR
jgi:hypothetical protein